MTHINIKIRKGKRMQTQRRRCKTTRFADLLPSLLVCFELAHIFHTFTYVRIYERQKEMRSLPGRKGKRKMV